MVGDFLSSEYICSCNARYGLINKCICSYDHSIFPNESSYFFCYLYIAIAKHKLRCDHCLAYNTAPGIIFKTDKVHVRRHPTLAHFIDKSIKGNSGNRANTITGILNIAKGFVGYSIILASRKTTTKNGL